MYLGRVGIRNSFFNLTQNEPYFFKFYLIIIFSCFEVDLVLNLNNLTANHCNFYLYLNQNSNILRFYFKNYKL